MKYYGFNPFIRSFENGVEGILYNLLEKEILRVDYHLVSLFSGKVYKSIEEIERLSTGFRISKSELRDIIEEGLREGILLELEAPYWRNEAIPAMERQLLKQEILFFFRNIILQPSGICDRGCSFCNSYINCCCFADSNSWSRSQLDNLLKDLRRYRGSLGCVHIMGGNPLLYDDLAYLLGALKNLGFKVIELKIPFSKLLFNKADVLGNLKKELRDILKLTYMIFTSFADIDESVLRVLLDIESDPVFELMIDGDRPDKTSEIENILGNNRVSKNYLLRKDRSNIEWYAKSVNEDFLEGLSLEDFYFRKSLHRCWGNSFSINSRGDIRPCLWSDTIVGKWNNGFVIDYFDDLENKEKFWLRNHLGNIQGCSGCIYRFGCRDCRVAAEFLSNKKNTKNPLCNK